MRIGLVSGDGVPVSGLLTIFRNVIDLGRRDGLVEAGPVPAELGYSWRPDKPGYFPDGPPDPEGHEFLAPLPIPLPSGPAAAEWTAVRNAVALNDSADREELRRRIDRLAAPYREYFGRWLQEAQVDWVCAVNMTLSDAVPVTTALHQAAAEYYGARGSGGVLFWDHDLFGSCAIFEKGQRVYPQHPNEFTTLPADEPFHRWAVVSESLAQECRQYPTGAEPHIVPNVLPEVPTGPLADRHHEFLRQQGISPGRPILLNPVRVFRVKGVEIALDVLAGARPGHDDDQAPVLLVFGGLSEDPVYAQEVVTKARALGLEQDLRFLEGVPLRSYQDGTGHWHLDEVDLLRLAAAGRGGVLFTPNLLDVETVGLGPALAAVAGIPCAVTDYDAFVPTYGKDFWTVRVGPSPQDAQQAGQELMTVLRTRPAELEDRLRRNRQIAQENFPTGPWLDLLRELSGAAGRTQEKTPE
ncbi:hypothetical protein [Kineosporia sp. NBRC 101731]|uniref:hypothetical protein n=1 Tax=Kineosporia sp. NBRC 101731 TaxID=3032199 RepID=UPI0024A26F6C|nr:hypothetical protein [Kineosporia sp. NBRC 101731]GLY30883.1 hypothetical protein Kisp02_42480 [Kineosporia sp. NBRC 101731]